MRHKAIAIIGGSGFIGSHLVNALVEMGKDVRIATRRRYNARHLTLLPIDVIETDVFDPVQLARFVEETDCVINLVGTLHGKRRTPYGPEFARAHVELPTRIAAACEGKGVHRLIHLSALGADSNGPSMYARSKGDGEKAVHASNLAWTVFRPSVVFGPEDRFLNMFARLQRHLPIVPLACAHARFQPVYVGDVAEAYVRALLDRHTDGFIYELGGPQVYELEELVRLAGRYAGHERRILALPDGLARLQARFFELLPGEPVITRDNLDSMKVDNVVHPSTNNKVLTTAALGIKLTALEAVAPQYLAPPGGLDVLRARAGR